MSVAADLASAAEAALAQVDPDEEVAAVIPCDPAGDGALVYLCALRARGDDELTGWAALDARGVPLGDEALVRRTASIAALCETAEEAAGVPEAGQLAEAVAAARGLADDPALEAALAGCEPPARALDEGATPPRVASDAYVDAIGREVMRLDGAGQALRPLAEALSARLSGTPGDPGEPLARAVWEVVGRIAQAGGAARLADQLGAATGAIDAFAEDVVRGYRLPLAGEEQADG
jgi:hypothetical protein